MMRIKSTLILALTKLKTRRVRLTISVVVSGLLLSLLAAASLISSGVFSSLSTFSSDGFGNRFIVSGVTSHEDYNITYSQSIIDRASAIQKQIIAQKKAYAARVGITYDPNTERAPYVDAYNATNSVKQVNNLSIGGAQALSEYSASNPIPGLKNMKNELKSFNPIGYFQMRILGPRSIFSANSTQPYLQVLKSGQESFQATGTNLSSTQTATEMFNATWALASKDLMKPFLLPGATTELGVDKSMPIIAPYTAVEQFLGLPPLSKNATSNQKLDRIKFVRSKAQTITFSVCYRNASSAKELTDVITQQQEIKQNKNNKDYQKPEYIKDVPTTACGSPPVIRDVRTPEDVADANKNIIFNQNFGEQVPAATILNFKVVGISADTSNGGFDLTQILSSLLASSISGRTNMLWFSPIETSEKMPVYKEIFGDLSIPAASDFYFAELRSAADEKAVLAAGDCISKISNNPNTDPNGSGIKKCEAEGKSFILSPYGSSSYALSGPKKTFSKFFGYASELFIVLSALIMLGTVGKIISDSRRETAVFRAIGAKRSDVVQIYLTYVFFLAILIFMFAILVGGGIAIYVQSQYASSFTVSALIAFNSTDLNKQFSLFGFSLKGVLSILVIAVSGAIASAIIPLISNLRRSPMKDMRDEN